MTQHFAGAPDASGAEAVQIATRLQNAPEPRRARLTLPEIVAEAWRAHPVDAGIRGASGARLGIPRNYDAMAPLLRARLDESRGTTPAAYDEAMGIATAPDTRWQKCSKMSTYC